MAMNLEHSYSDGLGWARFIHEVMCDVHGRQDLLPPSACPITITILPPPPSLITSLNGNTVRNFPTHGQLSAAQGSPTTVSA